MKRQDIEIEKTLNSLNETEPVYPSPVMANRIYWKAMREKPEVHEPAGPAWAWVMGMAALFLINVGVLYWMQTDNPKNEMVNTNIYFDSGLSY